MKTPLPFGPLWAARPHPCPIDETGNARIVPLSAIIHRGKKAAETTSARFMGMSFMSLVGRPLALSLLPPSVRDDLD